MNGYAAFAKKEFKENTSNFRLLIMLALYFVFGVLSPLTAKFMPELLASLAPDMPVAFSDPVALDSWAQFYKNVSGMGFSAFIILFGSCLSGEYTKGTLTILLTKGLSRPSVILAKFSAAAVIMSVSYWICFGLTYWYTAYLWQGEVLQHTVFAACALWIIGFMYLGILMLGCVLFRQAFTSILFTGGVIALMSLIGMISQIADYSPFVLTGKNLDLLSGAAEISGFVIPIVVALVITAGTLAASIALFNRKRL